MDTLQPVSAICLALIAVLGAMWLFAKDHRAKTSTALVLVLTVYVGYGLYGLLTEKSRAKSGSTIQVDQSEVFLRIGSAINSMGNSVSAAAHAKAPPAPEKMFKDFMRDSEKVLDKSFASDPKNAALAARRVILFHEMHEPINLALEQLKQTEPTEGPALAKDLEFIYSGWLDKTGAERSEKPHEKAATDGRANKSDEKSDKKNAVSSKTDAVSSKTDAASSKTDAASGKTDAASGKTDAASSKTDAVSGKTDAASSKTDAASGKTDAASGKTSAASGTTVAASSKTNAASSKTVAASNRADARAHSKLVEEDLIRRLPVGTATLP